MSQPAARLGDMTAHGGVVTTGNPTVLINGQPAATVGDLHACPLCSPGPHVGGPVLLGAPTVLIGGRPAARVGDTCACAAPAPDVIVSGSPNVLIGAASGAGTAAATAAAASAASASVRPGTPGTGTSARPLSPWVGVGYADPSGRPVAGWAYHAEGGADARDGAVGTGGQVWCDGLAGGGAVDVGLVGVYGCRWERAEARVGEPVGMSARCAGVEDGAFAAFEVYRVATDPGGAVERALVWTRLGEVAGGRVEALEPFVEPDEPVEDEATAVWYEVEAVVEHVHRARGGALRLRDDIALRVLDEEGEPVRDLPHEVRVAVGEVHGLQTDRGGAAGISDVQPGRYRVALPLSRGAGRGPNAEGMGEPPGEADRFSVRVGVPSVRGRLVYGTLRAPRLDGTAPPRQTPTVSYTLWSDARSFRGVGAVRVTVSSTSGVFYREELRGTGVAAGTHVWTWDGLDQNGVYDSAALRRGIEVTVEATSRGRTASDTIAFRPSPLGGAGVATSYSWADVRVDTRGKTADVSFYLEFQNSGHIAFVRGGLSPRELLGEPIPDVEFQRLQQLAINGISHYWSRTGSKRVSGYAVRVSAIDRRSEPSHNVEIVVNREARSARSRNFPVVDPVLVYDLAPLQSRNPATPLPTLRAQADRAFRYVAAHELGHSIVASTQGRGESYTHHETSTMTTQRTLASAPAYPSTGEIDLMRYYNGNRPANRFQRTIASERDVRAMVEGSALRLFVR